MVGWSEFVGHRADVECVGCVAMAGFGKWFVFCVCSGVGTGDVGEQLDEPQWGLRKGTAVAARVRVGSFERAYAK